MTSTITSNYSRNIEKEYSPSCWSTRFTNSLDVLNNHLNLVKVASAKAREQCKYETVAYGSASSNETFDIFGIDLPDDSPIFVYVHGGYWQLLSKNDSAYCVESLCRVYKVIVLDYDLCPTITLSNLVQQICRAGQFIFNYAKKIGAKHLSFCGHSAGAHLIACMLNEFTTNTQLYQINNLNLLQSIYLISGIFDLRELKDTSQNENNLLSLTVDNVCRLSPLLFKNLSNWHNFIENIHIFVAAKDSPTFIEHSYDLHKLVVNSKFRLIDDCDHFDIVEKFVDINYELVQIILNNL